MSSRLIRHPVHWVFYACPYAGYVAALFLAASLGDIGSVTHTCLRVLLSAFEVATCALAGCWLLGRWLATRRIRWWLLYVLLAALVALVYVAQIQSIRISNNFISVLAIQNARYSLFTLSPAAMVWFGLGLVWIAALAVYAWRGTVLRTRTAGLTAPGRIGRKGALAILVVGLVLFAGLLTQQRRDVSLEPGFLQTPIASLVANAWVAAAGAPRPAHGAFSGTCLRDPGAGQVPGYPFQKSLVYRDPLPFTRVPDTTATPNVLVFFTEGTSARLIGAYGGKYPGLTPNIDRLAARSLRVVNYFNHTAATYRGITGQTTSGFTFANGNAWHQGDNGTLLAMVNRQTLADILNRKGYASYFFEPEHPGAFTDLLRSLGFSQIYNFDRIAALLHGDVKVQRQTDQLDDDSLFRGLTRFLERRVASGDRQPFFIGAYNIGTHAFIPVADGGDKYADGANQALNKLHNYDAAIGRFLDWFYASPYADNTIVIFTSDHATYPEQDYRAVAGPDLKPYFVDRIPLLIFDPTHRLPALLDARGRNSLDIAPTLLQLLGIQRVSNSFLGHSLFEPRSLPIGISALGANFYVTTTDGLFVAAHAPANLQAVAACERNVVQAYYDSELANRLFRPPAGSSRLPPPVADHYCALDKINGELAKSFSGRLKIGQPATFGGWFASTGRARVGEFAIQLKGGPGFFMPAHQTVPRPDVAKAIGGRGPDTYGFAARTDLTGASPGRYAVTFVAADGEICDTGRQVDLVN